MITLTLVDRSREWLGEVVEICEVTFEETREQARGHHGGVVVGGQLDGLVAGGRQGGLSVGGRLDGLAVGGRLDGLAVSGRQGGLSVSGRQGGLSVGGRQGGLSVGGHHGGVVVGGQLDGLVAGGRQGGLSVGGRLDGLSVGGYSACELARKSIVLTPLGRLVADKWREIADNWPGVEVGEFIIMPDHLHGILKITRRQRHPLGQIVGSFKARSTSAARALAGVGVPPSLLGGSSSGSSLWSTGLVDSILWSDERFCRALAYIADNPRRLAAKRANPRFFTVRRDLAVRLPLGDGGADITAHFSAIGNDSLLGRLDFHQVQCSRRFFAYATDKWGKPLKDRPPACETAEFKAIADEALAATADGAVLVNPCISQGEREIARRAFAAGAPLIVLRNKGFSPLFKPEGSLFDRCVAGKLLMLAPAAWPYVPGNKPMSRDDACAMNRIAQAIARDGAAEIDYKGRAPLLIDQSAREAVSQNTRTL